MDLDDFDDVAPDALAQVSKRKSKKMSSEKAEEKQRAKAIAAHKKSENVSLRNLLCHKILFDS